MYYRSTVLVEVTITNGQQTEDHEAFARQFSRRMEDYLQKSAARIVNLYQPPFRFDVHVRSHLDHFEHRDEWRRRKPIKFP